MPTYRERNGKIQAIVRIKRGGAIVHQEMKTFPSKKLAESWAEQVEARILTVGVPDRKLQVVTLGQLMLNYLETLQAHKEVRRTRAAEIEQIATPFMRVKLNELTSETFSKYAQARRAEGTGPATVMHNLATIRSILNAAKAMFSLDVNGDCVKEAIDAMTRVGVIARPEERDRRVNDETLDKLVNEFKRISGNPSTLIPMHVIVPLAVALPRRLGELTDMKWVDYKPEVSIIKLRDTKHPRKPRDEVIPVPAAAKAIIDALPVTDERILPYKSESVSASFQRACQRLAIHDLHFHDLRHEGISRLFEQGLSIPEVAMISGHTSWVMLRRYTNLSVETLAEKLNAGINQAPKAGAESSRSEPGDGGDPDSQDS